MTLVNKRLLLLLLQIGWTGKLQVDIQLSHPLEGPLIPFLN
jgi:hypothetical protein